ncbi:acyl-CoA dehydrogenase family protein [Bradyrhizobium tropiciagri]|uniref:acyl-CoA dehydrogenase family protein n=1 Tax=Bradyrhizobium tropiciagri TaxID=312253 RepID=UPI001BA8D1C3|nr:acyl-CoA dehydrogenase family protein [Bradyrhizobium tropiciagri]MBR0895946.1 acyl-CoA dehydrogenase family protein [Bradyrhizobium tropiciagri]
MHFTEDQIAFRNTLRRFIDKEVVPIADEVDRNDRFPKELVPKFGDMGLLQLRLPEAYGGPGANLTTVCIAAEEFAKVSESIALISGQNGIAMIVPLVYFGNEEQRRRFFPEIAEGRTLTAVAITEPQSGSDVGSMKTRAVSDGNGAYILNGEKCFITFAPVADYILVFARVGDPSGGTRNISAFIVDAKSPGVTIGKNERKLGLNGIPNAPVYLENVKVPVENRVGEEGDGFKISMRILDMNRPTIGAVSVGLAQGALDAAIKYAKERKQFGKAIAEFQGLQFMLADMAMHVEAARSLVYDCASIADAGFDSDAAFRAFSAKASMAKCFASDMAMKVTTDAVQIFGGAGYMKDFPVERYMRDAKINQIFEGTNQIHRLIVARHLLA